MYDVIIQPRPQGAFPKAREKRPGDEVGHHHAVEVFLPFCRKQPTFGDATTGFLCGFPAGKPVVACQMSAVFSR